MQENTGKDNKVSIVDYWAICSQYHNNKQCYTVAHCNMLLLMCYLILALVLMAVTSFVLLDFAMRPSLSLAKMSCGCFMLMVLIFGWLCCCSLRLSALVTNYHISTYLWQYQYELHTPVHNSRSFHMTCNRVIFIDGCMMWIALLCTIQVFVKKKHTWRKLHLHCSCDCYHITTHVLSTWTVLFYYYFPDVCVMWTA